MKRRFITIAGMAILVIASVLAVWYFIATSSEGQIQQPSTSETTIPSSENSENSSFSSDGMSSDQEEKPVEERILPENVKIKEGVIFSKVGDPLTIRSRTYDLDEVHEEQVPSLGWNGDLQLTVNEAKLVTYNPDDGNPWHEQFSAYSESMLFEEPAVLLLDISLTNIDASQNFGVKYDFHPKFQLASEMLYSEEFDLDPGLFDPILEFVNNEPYFSAHASGDDYYTLSLPEGECAEFECAYFVDSTVFNNTVLYLCPTSGSARSAYYGVELDQIERE